MKTNPESNSRCSKRFFSRWRRLDRRYHGAIGWGIVAVATVVMLTLGTVGFHKNLTVTEPDKYYSIATLLFMALQMLVLNAGNASEPVGWELETARVLAVMVFSGTVLKTLAAVFHKPYEVLRVRFLLKDHVIICGSDQKGSRLAGDLLAAGESVVVVEREMEHRDVEELRDLGAYIVAGDATHPQTLENAGIYRASRMLIVCGDDATNVEIAAASGKLCRSGRSASFAKLASHVHCVDRRLFAFLESSAKGGSEESRVDFYRFDVLLNGARLLLEEHPLDWKPIAVNSASVVQLVLIGWTRESECLLLQTARLGHFANLLQPRIKVVDPDAATHEQRLRFRFPQIGNVCQFEFVSRDLDHSSTLADVERWIGEETAITTLVVSPTNENQSLPLALGLPSIVSERDVPVFVRLSQREQLAGLLQIKDRRPRLIPFGSLANTGNATTVIHAELDRLAKEIHKAYVQMRTEEGDSPAKFPKMRPWGELAESDKEANRDQADHMAVKLRAVNCLAVPQDQLQGRELAQWTEEEIETLAKMEHQRWNANRWLDGWHLGPRDDSKKSHNNLVPWEELDEKTRNYDREPARNILKLLELAGRAVARCDNAPRTA